MVSETGQHPYTIGRLVPLPQGCRNPGPPEVMGATGVEPGIAELIAALHAQTEAMQALTQSNMMLSAAVAELLGEEAGNPVQPEEPKEPAHTSLDGDE